MQLALGCGGRNARNLANIYKEKHWLENEGTNVYGVGHGSRSLRGNETNSASYVLQADDIIAA